MEKSGRILRAATARGAVLLVGLLLVLQACGGDESQEEYAAVAPPMSEDPAAEASRDLAQPDGRAQSSTLQIGDTAAVPRLVVRDAEAAIEVDSVESAMRRLSRLVERSGGVVTSSRIVRAEEGGRFGQVTARVPAERFDALLSQLDELGRVEEVSVTSEDRTEEFVDASARVANARRLEQRLLDLLRERTGSLEEVLAVERELTRIREEIERIEGRLRYLRSRGATSTLNVNLHEPEGVFQGTGSPGRLLRDAVRDAGRNFVLFVAGFISMLGILLPLMGLAVVGLWGYRRFRARGKG